MKRILLIAMLFPFSAYSQVFQKCVDADGKITYADFCPTSEPVRVEPLYIPNTYNAESDYLVQENISGMEENTRQSINDRHEKNAKNRLRGTGAPTEYKTSEEKKIYAERKQAAKEHHNREMLVPAPTTIIIRHY